MGRLIDPRKKSLKPSIIHIIVGSILLVLSVVLWFVLRYYINKSDISESYSIIKYLLMLVGSIGFLIALSGVTNLIDVIKENEYLKHPDYAFDYEKELASYKYVGREVKPKKLEKSGATSYKNYLEWKKAITDNNTLGIKEYNFYRYLIDRKRRVESYIDMVKTVVIPIELGIIAVFCTGQETSDYGFNYLTCVIASIVLLIIIVIEINNKESEKNFISDVCEIIDERTESEHKAAS